MSVFEYNLYLTCTKVCRSPQVQSIATAIKVAIKEYFWTALEIIIVLLDINYLCLLVPKLNLLPNDACFKLSDYDIPMSIYDIFKLILSVLFSHLYLKYFKYRCGWESHKWLENVIIVGSYIGVFSIVLILGCIGLIIVPNTTFEKVYFFILLIVSYFVYYMACTKNWFDKYIYSACYTYTSTVNHIVLKDRQYLIVSNLATRWNTKKVKKITQKENKTAQSASQDPRLNKHIVVNKDLNDIYNQPLSLNKSQPQDGEDEYLISSRIVRPDSYYDQLDTSVWGKSELNEYPNKSRQFKPIPM